jgi:hypothetical protein
MPTFPEIADGNSHNNALRHVLGWINSVHHRPGPEEPPDQQEFKVEEEHCEQRKLGAGQWIVNQHSVEPISGLQLLGQGKS